MSDWARVAYLGPEGTFTEKAARGLVSGFEVRAFESVEPIEGVCEAVAASRVSAGVVPIFNTEVGIYDQTAEALQRHESLVAIRVSRFPVRFSLYAQELDGANVKTVVSHESALWQCRKYIARRQLTQQSRDSTAQAFQELANGELGPAIGAIAGEGLVAANVFEVAKHETIVDAGSHETSFLLLVRRDDDVAAISGGSALGIVGATRSGEFPESDRRPGWLPPPKPRWLLLKRQSNEPWSAHHNVRYIGSPVEVKETVNVVDAG